MIFDENQYIYFVTADFQDVINISYYQHQTNFTNNINKMLVVSF
jgi:hypothetical protein